MAALSPRLLLRIDTLEEDVYCLTSMNYQDTKLLLTGHGQGIIKLWDSKGTLTNTIKLPFSDDVMSICATPTILAVSVSNYIVLYDPKQLGQEPLEICKHNLDEINQISINSAGNFLLAADDAGHIVIIDISLPKRSKHRTTCRYHDTCFTATFHPQRRWEMISGGSDSQLILWDYSRGRPLDVLDIKEALSSNSGPYYINPPMIHSLCSFDNKPFIAAGLGNGTIALLNVSGGKIKLLSIVNCHSNSIAGVVCFSMNEPFEELEREGGTVYCTDIIVSGGNDCKIIWSRVIKTIPTSGRGGNGATVKSIPVYSIDREPLNVCDHGSKVNWIEKLTGWSQEERVVGVADQTSLVTLYTF